MRPAFGPCSIVGSDTDDTSDADEGPNSPPREASPPHRLPPGLATIPLQRVRHFVARERLSERLRARLHEKATQASKTVVVHGLGGSGKSQLVLDYLQTHAHRYTDLFWVSADGRSAVDRQMRSIYQQICAAPGEQNADMSTDEVLSRLKRWFSNAKGLYLWIFDSADNVENHDDPEFIDFSRIMVPLPCVCTLITSRSAALAEMATSAAIQVTTLGADEALNLLLKTAGMSEQDTSTKNLSHAAKIVEELGHFPLAINLAGSTIGASPSRMKRDLSLYLEEYKSNRGRVLSKAPNWNIHQYSESTLTTWETSFAHLAHRLPLAARLLGTLSFFDPSDLFIEIFEWSLGGADASEPTPMWEVEEAYQALQSLSFIVPRELKNGLTTFTMHKLVQEWALERLKLDVRIDYAGVVCRIFGSILRNGQRNPSEKERLGKHISKAAHDIMRLITLLKDRHKAVPDVRVTVLLVIFDTYADFLLASGHWVSSKEIRDYKYQAMVDMYGPEHHETVDALVNLAETLLAQRRGAEALPMLRRALESRTRTHGEADPATTLIKRNIDMLSSDKETLAAAEIAQRDELEREMANNGEDSDSITAAKNNLAAFLFAQERYGEAGVLFREVLETARRARGEAHPHTIDAMSNLAAVCATEERFEEAEALLREARRRAIETHGEHHPTIAYLSKRLALTLLKLGQDSQLAEGLSIMQHAEDVSIRENAQVDFEARALVAALSSCTLGRLRPGQGFEGRVLVAALSSMPLAPESWPGLRR